MKQFFFSLCLVLCCGLVGSFAVSKHLYKFQPSRDPAAIRQIYDVTHLRGSALDMAVKERLVAGLETYQDQDGFGIGLGHFAFSQDNGEKVLGCRAYQKVTMTFESEGMAVNGEKAQMTIEGKCEYSNDLTKINPLWIPVARIFGEKPGDGDFSDYQRPAKLVFSNVAEHWPRQWVLIGLTIQGENRQITITKDEVGQILGQPFMINLE